MAHLFRDSPLAPKIGVLGGAFNPLHFGHLRPAREVLDRLALEKILFLPSGEHPLKKGSAMAATEDRLAMLKLALAPESQFELCDLDSKRPGISYSVDTLAELANHYPDRELVFIVGGDILTELHLWKDWPKILDHSHMVMMVRPGFPAVTPADDRVASFLEQHRVDSHKQLNCQETGLYGFMQLVVAPCAISSTQIRDLVRNRTNIRSFTPDVVVDYIMQNQLYLSE
jgi:nicotinate-nucleotide adenylyltransferase